jgi:serine/threonine-protein kinase
MGFIAGTKLGPYEILRPIGAGGFGQVYKARDTRLNRFVAIKVLPEHLSKDPTLAVRFEREAKTLASLSHPHICPVYDVGKENDADFIVMEFLEGLTLAQRLGKGALPIEDALEIGADLADALAAAHRAGITHRDVKPGNVMLTKSGPKLLDFGLAKTHLHAVSFGVQSDAPTAAASLTGQGTILGTLQYMAPEQLEGKESDARTDIFAFGTVLYEMVTGNKPFLGTSAVRLIGSILKDTPKSVSALQPVAPETLDRIVSKCLAKDPEDRWQSARDLGDALRWVDNRSSATNQALPKPKTPTIKWALLLGLVAVALLAGIAIGFPIWNTPRATPSPLRFTIDLPAGDVLMNSDRPAIAISPNGKIPAYVAIRNGVQQLFLHFMDTFDFKPISDTDGAISPFFSSDSEWVGFLTDTGIYKVSVRGGAVVPVAKMGTKTSGAAWSDHGQIAFGFIGTPSPLFQVPEAGGESQPLTQQSSQERTHRWPDFLPGGKSVLFAVSTSNFSWNQAQIVEQELSPAGKRSILVQGATQPRYAASGHLLYAQGGTIMAAPFDGVGGPGTAVPVQDGVQQYASTGAAQYGVSSTGTLVYVAGGLDPERSNLVWVGRTTRQERMLNAEPRSYRNPRISPDGTRVVVTADAGESQLWIYDLAHDTLRRLTPSEGKLSTLGVWSPNSKRVAFASQRDGPQSIYWQLADGSGGVERLTTGERQSPNSFSPDGNLLAIVENTPTDAGRDILIVNLSDKKVLPFLRTLADEGAPMFSPVDGRWLAYSSNVTNRMEVYVRPYPGPGAEHKISKDGGTEPVWNANGRELFFRDGDKMMSVLFDPKSGDPVGKPAVLFEGTYYPTAGSFPNYDVSRDGQQFLMLKPIAPQSSAPTQIHVVVNWFEELKKKVPAKP